MLSDILKKLKMKNLDPQTRRSIEDSIRKNNLAVDIVIVNYNSLNYLKDCLESIYKNTIYPYNIIIVDNNSSDGGKDYLQKLDNDNVSVIINQKNTGCSLWLVWLIQILKLL